MVGGVEGGWRPISLPPVCTALHYHKSWLLCYRSSNALLAVSIKIFKRNKVNCNCELNVPCARLLEVNYYIPQLGFNFIKIFLYLQVFASVAVTLTFSINLLFEKVPTLWFKIIIFFFKMVPNIPNYSVLNCFIFFFLLKKISYILNNFVFFRMFLYF